MPNQLDESVKRHAIEFLCLQSKLPFELVARIYELEYATLERGARVKKFLPIFTFRNVQEQLLLLHPA
jgi:hypothetical protein